MEMWNGYKTYIGVVLFGVVQLLRLWMPDNAGIYDIIEPLAVTLTGIGIGHKLEKMI